jgi:uncharacterized lipoprotein YddW (UPF0748 family)
MKARPSTDTATSAWRRRDWLAAALGLPLVWTGCTPAPHVQSLPVVAPATGTTEFRGAWVATVSNIDWPSRPGLSDAEQQAEIDRIVDLAAGLGLTALLLQVRPACDAIYPSALEPWTEFLSGTQGVGPGYDPLQRWLDRTRAAGLQLHAWINPYRARHASQRSPLAASHIASTHPELVRPVGDQLWLDPGEPEAARYTLAVARDLLSRYALHGLHIDDYFYPYPVQDARGRALDFPDDAPWQRYLQSGGALARADWRRAQVNALVQALHALVHELRPEACFSVSPFGIGRPDRRPAGISGFSQYDRLYADPETWCREGWLDALCPQLYWPLDAPGQAFGTLADYWKTQLIPGQKLWPGLYANGVGTGPSGWPAQQILDQIALLRVHGIEGHVHFSMQALLQDRGGLAQALREGPYRQRGPAP